MSIKNRTRKTVLAEREVFALSRWEQAIGLMFRSPHEGVVFIFMPQRKVYLHMWFVPVPIDVIALDGQGKVLGMKEHFRPWAIWRPGMPASAIVELPAGTIARSLTEVGDSIALPQPMQSRYWRWYHYLLFLLSQALLSIILIGIVILLFTIVQ